MKRAFAFAGFSSAIVLIVLNIVGIRLAAAVAFASSILLVISLLFKVLRQGRVVPIVFGAALFSCLVFMLVTVKTVAPQQELAEKGDEVPVSFCITDIPYKNDYGYCYEIKTYKVLADGAPQNIKLDLYTKNKINADYYDCVDAALSFRSAGSKAMDSYGSFGEGKYLVAFLSDECTVHKSKQKPLNYYIIKARQRLIDNLESALGDYSGLSIALITGDKSRLPADVLSDFRICGMSHIIAVSGMHIMLVCAGVYYFIKKAGANIYFAGLLSVFILIFYMGLAGFSKSVLRAGIMLIVFILSNLFDKKSDSLNSLGIAVFIICFNPFSVCDVSAVLTACATLGIVVVYPEARKLVNVKNKALSYVADSLAFTFGVMLSTLPALWIFFGTVSLVSFLINIIIIVPVEFALVSSLACGAVGNIAVIGALPRIIALLFNKGIIRIAHLFAKYFSFLFIDISSVYFALSMAALLLLAGAGVLLFGKINFRHLVMLVIVMFALSSFASLYEANTSVYLCAQGKCIVVYNKECAVIADADDSSDFYFVKDVLKVNSPHNILFVSCDYESEALSNFAKDNAVFVKDNELSVDLCNAVSVKYDGKCIYFNAYNDKIIIDDNYINVNSLDFDRGCDESLQFCFKNGREFQLRRISNG